MWEMVGLPKSYWSVTLGDMRMITIYHGLCSSWKWYSEPIMFNLCSNIHQPSQQDEQEQIYPNIIWAWGPFAWFFSFILGQWNSADLLLYSSTSIEIVPLVAWFSMQVLEFSSLTYQLSTNLESHFPVMYQHGLGVVVYGPYQSIATLYTIVQSIISTT